MPSQCWWDFPPDDLEWGGKLRCHCIESVIGQSFYLDFSTLTKLTQHPRINLAWSCCHLLMRAKTLICLSNIDIWICGQRWTSNIKVGIIMMNNWREDHQLWGAWPPSASPARTETKYVSKISENISVKNLKKLLSLNWKQSSENMICEILSGSKKH